MPVPEFPGRGRPSSVTSTSAYRPSTRTMTRACWAVECRMTLVSASCAVR